LGIGGGFILVPFMVLLGVPMPIAVGTAYIQTAVSSLNAVINYHQRHLIDYKMATFLTSGGVVGAAVGVCIFKLIATYYDIDYINKIIFIILLCFIILLLMKKPPETSYNMPVQSNTLISSFVGIGGIIGMLSGLLAIGGGILIVPFLTYFIKTDILKAKAISQFNILCVAIVSLIMHGFINDNINVTLGIVLTIGATIGTFIGLRCDHIIPKATSRYIFMIIMIATICMLIYNLVNYASH